MSGFARRNDAFSVPPSRSEKRDGCDAARIPPGIKGVNVVQEKAPVEGVPEPGGLRDPRLFRARAAIENLTALCTDENERWWYDPETWALRDRKAPELLMLCVSELAEAMEGDRKGLADDHLPHHDMFTVELADCLIRIFDMAGHLAPNLAAAFVEKIEYNRQREDHKHETRQQAGGKRY